MKTHTVAYPLCLTLILAGGTAVFAWGNHVPFVFDDIYSILLNPHIRSLWPLWEAMTPPPVATIAGRPIVALTLALNYQISGRNVWSYHLVNLAMHLANALLLLFIIHRSLTQPRWHGRYAAAAPWLAAVTMLLWLIHPLQVESVVYIIQRTELLVAFFYLATLACCIQGWAAQRPMTWYVLAVAACAFGMASKEVMVTAPVLILLYDRCLVSGTFSQALRRRPGLYAGLAAIWLVLALVLWAAPRGNSVTMTGPISALDYLRTQAGVILGYLQRSFWPTGLAFYHDPPIAFHWSDTLAPSAVVVVLLGATAWALWRYPPAGLLGAWFFIILSPTSSFVPILTELAADRRMYLPLAAVALGAVLLGWALLRRLPHRTALGAGGALVVTVAAALIPITLQRIAVLHSEISLWLDARKVYPDSVVILGFLGTAYQGERCLPESLTCYRAVSARLPQWGYVHFRISYDLLLMGLYAQAEHSARTALQLDPNLFDARMVLAYSLLYQNRYEEARQTAEQILTPCPAHPEALNILGLVQLHDGDTQVAARYFATAINSDPLNARALKNLAQILADEGRLKEALVLYVEAQQIYPIDPTVYDSLAYTYARAGRSAAAVAAAQQALALALPMQNSVLTAGIKKRLALYCAGQTPPTRPAEE